jgi:ComF family protein
MLNDFISIIFPECCVGCTVVLMKGELHICSSCTLKLPIVDKTEYEELIHSRFYGRFRFEHCFSYLKFVKGGLAQKILFALKYQNNTTIGTYFGSLLAHSMSNESYTKSFDLIIPVPLHKKRFKSRGYNQSDILADALGQVFKIPVYKHVVTREKYSESFTRKNRLERTGHLNEIFETKDLDLIRNKHVLLVDDVITTGSTLEAMAISLSSAGVDKISIGSMAIAI